LVVNYMKIKGLLNTGLEVQKQPFACHSEGATRSGLWVLRMTVFNTQFSPLFDPDPDSELRKFPVT
jgi:hypothetical protein